MSKYFTTEHAAQYLGVTPPRVRQFIIEERLESEKHGRDHLIKEQTAPLILPSEDKSIVALHGDTREIIQLLPDNTFQCRQ